MWNIPIVTFDFVAQSIAKGSLIAHQQYLIKALVVVSTIYRSMVPYSHNVNNLTSGIQLSRRKFSSC